MNTYKLKNVNADTELKPGECRLVEPPSVRLRCHHCGTNNQTTVKSPTVFKCVGCEQTFEITIER